MRDVVERISHTRGSGGRRPGRRSAEVRATIEGRAGNRCRSVMPQPEESLTWADEANVNHGFSMAPAAESGFSFWHGPTDQAVLPFSVRHQGLEPRTR